jgi:hypothetical protein
MIPPKIPRIEITYDYDKFSLIECNRPLNPKHVERIKKSILEIDLSPWNEIKVTSDLRILDGQHRFYALKDLGKPIFYMIYPGNEESYRFMMITMNNFQKAWTPFHYFHHYLVLKVPEFIEAEEFLKHYDVTFTLLNSIISRSPEEVQRFRKGNLNTQILRHPYMSILIKILKYLRKVKVKATHIISKGTFFRALLEFFDDKAVDIPEFCSQIYKHYHLLIHSTNVLGFIRCFVEIYNHNMKSERISIITQSSRGKETYKLVNLKDTNPSKNINLISFDEQPIKVRGKSKDKPSQYSFA